MFLVSHSFTPTAHNVHFTNNKTGTKLQTSNKRVSARIIASVIPTVLKLYTDNKQYTHYKFVDTVGISIVGSNILPEMLCALDDTAMCNRTPQ